MNLEEKLTDYAKRNALARAVFQTLAEMGKSRPTTDLNRFKARVTDTYGKPIDVKDLTDVFKTFQEMGLGKLILSRELSKNPHRFNWTHNNVEIGRAVLIPRAPSELPRLPRNTSHVPSGEPLPLVLSYPLRGRLFALEMPPDLSRAEAESLAAFIQRLGR